MAGEPASITQKSAGTAQYAGQVATITYTNNATSEALYIHFGFKPSVVWIWNETDPRLVMWTNTMANTEAARIIDTAAHAASGGITPYDGLVPSGSPYIRNGTATDSDGSDNDYITGILMADGDNGCGEDSDKMHVFALA